MSLKRIPWLRVRILWGLSSILRWSTWILFGFRPQKRNTRTLVRKRIPTIRRGNTWTVYAAAKGCMWTRRQWSTLRSRGLSRNKTETDTGSVGFAEFLKARLGQSRISEILHLDLYCWCKQFNGERTESWEHYPVKNNVTDWGVKCYLENEPQIALLKSSFGWPWSFSPVTRHARRMSRNNVTPRHGKRAWNRLAVELIWLVTVLAPDTRLAWHRLLHLTGLVNLIRKPLDFKKGFKHQQRFAVLWTDYSTKSREFQSVLHAISSRLAQMCVGWVVVSLAEWVRSDLESE